MDAARWLMLALSLIAALIVFSSMKPPRPRY